MGSRNGETVQLDAQSSAYCVRDVPALFLLQQSVGIAKFDCVRTAAIDFMHEVCFTNWSFIYLFAV